MCNAPTMDEVTIVLAEDHFRPKDSVLHSRNDQLTKIQKFIDAMMPYNLQSFFGMVQMDVSSTQRYMHEYVEDAIAMLSLRASRSIHYIDMQSTWDDIQKLLLPGQLPMDKFAITAYAVRQKLKSMMDLMVKHEVFGL
ncbi:unnamed protein product [Onchocerca ochengi]|uniref:DHC_N2 domain-containing protein n=1 Tax=Onchocerca ochengi TaxID=42157 RepID=A0A182ETN0_ONCOC|nr:unnamed protein product [Onchocerca ochengi]